MRTQGVIWISVLFGIIGYAHAVYDPTNAGIKTKTYRRDPITTNAYELNDQLAPPHQTPNYQRTTTIESLSSAQTNVRANEYQQNYPVPVLQPSLSPPPPPPQRQRQGNNNNNNNDYYRQQEIPLYQRSSTVSSDWNDAENAITEYYTGCPTGYTGQLPYAYDCRRFINCWHGRGHIQSCGAGTVFNPQTLECDRPDKVVCDPLSLLGDTHTHTDTHTSQQQSSVSNDRAGRLLDGTSENLDLLCPHGVNGLQPHPNDCTKFLNCANGVVHVQECGPGTAYSIPMMVCDYKDKVDCGEREYIYGDGMLDIRMGGLSGFDTKTSFKQKIGDIGCPPGESGLLPHPFDCTKFLNCAGGVTYIQDCGPGTVFDSINKNCGLKKDHCADHSTIANGDWTHTGKDENSDERKIFTNNYSGVDILCPADVTGLFVHPFDYTKFLICRNGDTAVQNCLSGTVFSISKGFCDRKENIQFVDHVSYIVSEVSYGYSKMLMSCPPETEGLHLYPYDCAKYINCASDGRLWVLECPSNTVFSQSKRKCLPKEQISSNDRVKYLYELKQKQSATGSDSNLLEDSGHMIGCPQATTGFFPYPFDSIKYVVCRDGQLSIETCASGTAFSLSKRQCLLKSRLRPNDMVLFRQEFAEEWSLQVGYGYGYGYGYGSTTGRMFLICPTKIDDGIYLHPFDCTKYIRCHKGVTYVEDCAMDTVFSISKEKCTHRDQVEIFDRTDYAISTKKQQQEVSCHSTDDGLHPHPFDCTKFLNCSNGVVQIESCGPGSVWNNKMEVCESMDKIDCIGRDGFNSKIECPSYIRDGYYPHPFDYTKYFSCYHGRGSLVRCPEGSAFSISRRKCEPIAEFSTRRDRVTLSMEFLADSKCQQSQNYGFVTCPANANGPYVYPFDCTKYIRCEFGRTNIEQCPSGEVFSMSTNSCMPQGEVETIDRVSFIMGSENNHRNWQTDDKNTGAFTSTSQIKSPVCPPGASGMHPHPYDCTKFLNCSNGETTIQSCGPGTVWSKDMEVCEFKDKVDCTGRLDYVDGWDKNNHFSSSMMNTQKISCPLDIGDGFYAHPFDYSRYFICQNGQSYVGHCGQGQVFSISRRICDDSDRVTMTDRVALLNEFRTEIDLVLNQNYGFVSCPAEIVGIFVYPFDCTKFLKCNYGETLIEVCPPDTVFSVTNRNCLSKSRVQRMDRVAFTDETKHDSYYWQNTEANMLILCPLGVNGYFQHPNDWTKYLDCTNGESIVKICPTGTVFSVSRGVCEMEINVSFDDRCHSDQRTGAYKIGREYQQQQQQQQNVIFTSPSSNVKCPSGASGLHPHPYDCKQFLNCANGMTHVQNCGPGTSFNSETNTCDFDYKVDCGHIVGETQLAKLSVPTSEGSYVECPAGITGLLPHPYDCTRFLNCADGTTHVQACGPGTAWSRDMEVCDFIGNVDCSNRISSNYQNNRISKTQGNQWNYGNQDRNTGATTSTIYTDRWTNMNMARPDTNIYGQSSSTIESSALWNRQQQQQQHGTNNYDGGYDYQQHTSSGTSKSNSNWSAVGSSTDRRTAQENVLYMEGSLEPNRNYINTFHTYKAPLAPLSSNTNLTSTTTTTKSTTTTTTTGTNKIYYAQPVDPETVENVDNPYAHASAVKPPYPYRYPVPMPNRQNHSRNINHISSSNSWTPIVRHEGTLETDSTQLPVQQYMPPLDIQSREPLEAPNAYLRPPLPKADNGQKPQDFDGLNGQFEVSSHDQIGSASDRRSVLSSPPLNHTNVSEGLNPPPISTSTSTKLTPLIPYDKSNLFGGLQPPNSNSDSDSTRIANNTNVRVHQIYPPLPNTTATRSHGPPHYSLPYSGVAHSRNTTWIGSRAYSDIPDSNTQRYNPNNGSLVASMPPSYNRQYYKGTISSPPTEMATDLVDTELPVSDALRMLLRPYFNRSGTVSDETAQKTESHIMRLVGDAHHSSTPRTTSQRIPFAATDHQQEQAEEDVELILAGEQPNLVNNPIDVRGVHRNQENLNQPSNWHKHNNHNRDFHLRHLNLPNPFDNDSKDSHLQSRPHAHPQPQPHPHSPHHHSPHHHSREFHLRHPDLPDPSPTREGDKSIIQTDLLDIPNPYAEPTTPIVVVDDDVNLSRSGYQVRLAGGESPHMGRVEVKVSGKWGYVCDDKFGLRDADVVCRELGFNLGASEVRGNSYYPPTDVNFAFAMDEVECYGNETKLKDCNFKGWGIHNCGPDEVVGVVCKVPLFKCPNNFWLCSTSKECIPTAFLCDNTPDCADNSDESEAVCKSPIEYRLEGGRNVNEGRLEVKYRGEWGTVCDDDFGIKEAQVLCNSLGYYGKPQIEKNIYGPGSGPIWLDQVSCLGNETSIDKCNHWTWGEHNCNHTEDVGIRCTAGPRPRPPPPPPSPPPPPRHSIRKNNMDDDGQRQREDSLDDTEFYGSGLERSSKFLYSQNNCGHFKSNIFDEFAHPEERVVNGTIAKRGRHPWQATIRTRGRGGISSHWCGAVLIGDGSTHQSSHLLTAAHCLAGYQKGAYFIRMGDHYANIAESSEIDSYIENWYIHEKFRDQTHMNNDIAVIVLKSPVRFNDYIQPVCLPEKGSTLQPNRQCTISGWGSIKSGISTPSNILRAAQVPILSDETCKQPHVYGSSLTDGMFCAGSMDESVDACDGDSGGPLVCSENGAETLHGIISWGQHCGYANKPGVYVRIEKYIDWIYEKINFSLQQNGKMI